MQANPGGHVALMTWSEVAAQAAADVVALLPVGAACKEHGLHLPMATDWLQAQWLAQRIGERRAVLTWPTLGYGHYPAFVEYPGSVSISEQTFAACVADVLDGIAATGVVACVVLNTGISTITPLRNAIAESNARHATRFVQHDVSAGASYQQVRQRIEQQRRGGHADEIETSVMLVVAPHLVRQERALPADGTEMASGPLRRTASTGVNHSPTGAYGDPTLATADKGRRLLAAMLDDLDGTLAACMTDARSS